MIEEDYSDKNPKWRGVPQCGDPNLATEVVKSYPTAALKAIPGLSGPKDLTVEYYREYDFIDANGQHRIYRISDPVAFYYRENGGTTHRVVDREGVVHCVPAPGFCGCVLRWKNRGVETGADPITY